MAAKTAKIVRVTGGGGFQRSSPNIVIRTPAAPKPKRQRRRKGGGGGGGSDKEVIGLAMAAGAVGYAKKAGYLDMLPSVPLIGRIGTLGVLAHFWQKNGGGQMARDVKLTCAVLAGYQLGNQGSIDGENE